MKKHKILALGILVVFLGLPIIARATNIAGRIITTRSDVSCAGYTAVNIKGLSGTYAVPNTKSVGSNKNILGKSNSFTTPICTQGDSPYSVYVVRSPFGVSR